MSGCPLQETLSGSFEEPTTPLLGDSTSEAPRRGAVALVRRASLDSQGLSGESAKSRSGAISQWCTAGSSAVLSGGTVSGGASEETQSVRSNTSFQFPPCGLDNSSGVFGRVAGFSVTPTFPSTCGGPGTAGLEPLVLEPTMRRTRSNTFHEKRVRECRHLTKRRLDGVTKAINDYIVYSQHVLGEGSYSKVKLCVHTQTQMFHAMKIMDKSRLRRLGIGGSSGLKKAQREIAILKQLRHENVIALLEVIDDPESCKLYLVLELAGYGALMEMQNDGTVVEDSEGNNKLPEAEARRIVRCIVSALKYVHSNGIAHRDIKPCNILLTDDMDVKLSDFGVSAIIDGSPLVSCREREGSVAFLSPELLRLEAGAEVDLFKADVWALGVTVFVMLHGRLPWIARAGTTPNQLEEIERSPLPPFRCNGASTISAEAIDFLTRCLEQCSDSRASMDELAGHPWLADGVVPTPFTRPAHAISVDDLEAAITRGQERELSSEERRTLPTVPDFILVRREPRYGVQHFAMAPHVLQQSFDDSCLALVRTTTSPGSAVFSGSEGGGSPVLSCPSPYGRARSSGRDASPSSRRGRRSISMPPLESPGGGGGAARSVSVLMESHSGSTFPNASLASTCTADTPEPTLSSH